MYGRSCFPVMVRQKLVRHIPMREVPVRRLLGKDPGRTNYRRDVKIYPVIGPELWNTNGRGVNVLKNRKYISF